MKKTLPTVTIAVCAHNEAKNIASFLSSVLKQDMRGYRLKQILVVSDGSTDKTVSIARKVQQTNKVIKIVEHKTRIGKSSHLNTIYKNLTTDFLVQTDADVIFQDTETVQNILKPMRKNPSISMTCGNPIPTEGITYLEKAHNVVYMSLCETHKPIRGGQNAFIADGRILGYRTSFIKHVTVPNDMIANDVFTYFACRARNLKAVYVPGANVLFRGPKNIEDKLRQNARAAAVKIRMTKHFSEALVQKEMHLPFSVNIRSKLKQFLRAPIMSVYMYSINMYCQAKAAKYEKQLSAVWPIAWTTKRVGGRI